VYASIPYSVAQAALHGQMLTKSAKVSVLAHTSPTDLAIESLRSLRTSLQFSMLDAKNNIVLVSGPTPGIGKSFVSVNFAAVLALSGKKVLLIDADLRKGHLHQYLGIERKNGFSDLVAGTCSVEQAMHKNIIENVDFIATGAVPPNPSELLGHSHIKKLLDGFSKDYDYVLIDTPPVLAVADTLILGPYAGSVFMVARAAQTTVGDIKESIKRFGQVGIPINGVVLNGILNRPGGYGYGYGKYRYTEYNY
jgi:tyrosine-protein kinase Etk/Wzc